MNCKFLNKDLKISLLGCGIILGGLYYFITHNDMTQYDDNNE